MARADAGRNDEELAARAAGGDERAFEALVKRYQARAWRLAARLVGAAGDPQDAVQEAFLNAYGACRVSAGRPVSRPGCTASSPTRH